MMDVFSYFGIVTLLLCLQTAGVAAVNPDIVGVTVAACVSFFLLCVVVTMIVVSFSWTSWYNSWMRGKGRVRMPREYFKKKEEARRRLLAESATHSVRSAQSASRHSRPPSVNLNGQPPRQTVDRAEHEQPDMTLKYPSMSSNKTSWVQGWNQSAGPRELETLDATMVLGDEQDEEFKIQTVLVDNEVLDVGPYKDSHPDEKPVEGDVYPVPYIYSAGDKAKSVPTQQTTLFASNGTTATTSHNPPAASTSSTGGTTLASSAPRQITATGEMVEVTDTHAYSTVEEAQKLEDMVVRL